MAEAGKYNTLRIIRETASGYYLDGGSLGEILMPGVYLPKGSIIGDQVDVFVYYDSEDRLVATTEEAYCETGDFVMLQVVQVNNTGAFLDWGLRKNLLVPFGEQKVKLTPGSWHIVYVYLDNDSNRIVASAKVEKFLDKEPASYHEGEKVELLVWQLTPLGFKVIINNQHSGMLYKNEVFQPLSMGEFIDGYISKVRDDDKIDVSLYKSGFDKTETSGDLVVQYLVQHGGFAMLTDKSPTEEIYHIFGISKKNFKMAIGTLYKNKVISIEADRIRLIDPKH